MQVYHSKEEIFNKSHDGSECESIPEEYHNTPSIIKSPTVSRRDTYVNNQGSLPDKDSIGIDDSSDLNHSIRIDRTSYIASNNTQEEDRMKIKSMMKNCTSSLNFHKTPRLQTLKMESDDQLLINCSSVKNFNRISEEAKYSSHVKNVSPLRLNTKFKKFSPFKDAKKSLEKRSKTKYSSNSKSFIQHRGSDISVRQENQIYVRSLEEFVDSNISCINSLIEYKKVTNQNIIKLNTICK